MPCDIVSLDCQDVMGSHFVNVGGGLYKQRIDSQGNPIEDKQLISANDHDHDDHSGHGHGHDHGANQLDRGKLIQAFKNKEGCHLHGYIKVNKVPGNFHISSHAYSHMIGTVLREAGL